MPQPNQSGILTRLTALGRNLWQGINRPSESSITLATDGFNRGKSVITGINQLQPTQAKLLIDEWESARDAALSPQNPVRQDLHDIYRMILLDLHVAGQLETRRIKSKGQPFVMVNRKTKQVSIEHTELMQRPWVFDIIGHFIDAIYWGHSLVELLYKTTSRSSLVTEEFNQVTLIPRDHVKPEIGHIVVNPFDQKGIDYRDKLWAPQLIEMGSSHNLGLLEGISREGIYKRFSMIDWARHSECFGQPMITYTPPPGTSAEEMKELDKQLQNVGTNRYILGKPGGDAPTLMSETGQSTHLMYLDRMKYADEQISKRVVGQTMTSDNGSSKAQGEVHERILDEFIESDMRDFQYWANFNLMPFLIANGYPFEDYDFVYKRFLADYTDPARIPSPTENAPSADGPAPEAKPKPAAKPNFKQPSPTKLALSDEGTPVIDIDNEIASFYATACHNHNHDHDHDHDFDPLQLASERRITNIGEEYLRSYYDKEGAVTLPSPLARFTYSRLKPALTLGYADGKADDKSTKLATDAGIEYDAQDERMIQLLEDATFNFSEFKDTAFHAELEKALVVNGKPATWAQFLESAQALKQVFNKNYLKAEYNHAYASAQMSAKWQDVDKNKKFYPNLVYRTANDDLVRPEHAALNEIIRPVDDKFWDVYYPPNGWNCRCTVIATANKNVTATPPTVDINPLFANNVGKTGDPFKGHPFTKAKASKATTSGNE